MATLDFALNAPDATVVWAVRADQYTAGNWPDRISSADATQATGANQPNAVADGGADFNNQPVVRFDGSNDLLAFTLARAQPFTVIAIAKVTLDNSSTRALLSDDSANSPQLHWNPSNQLQMRASSNVTDSANTLDTPLLVEAHYSGSSSFLRKNSVTAASGNAGTAGLSDSILIGANSTAGDTIFGGDIAEIIIVDGALTHADRVYLAQYAEQRYGIALPYPQTSNPTVTSIGSASTTHNANIPAAKKGELLLAFNSYFDGSNPSTPSGWTRIYRENDSTASGFWYGDLYAAVLASDFAGGTQNFPTLTNTFFVSQVYRVSLWGGSVGDIAAATGALTGVSGDAPDPPNLATPWGDRKALWIAAAHAFDDDAVVSGGDGSYTTVVSTRSGGGTNNGCSVGSQRRELAAASENPDAMALSLNQEWAAATVAVPGIQAVPLIASGAGIMSGGL